MGRDITGRWRAGMDRQDSWMAYEIESIEDLDSTTEYIRYEDKGDAPCGILRTQKTKNGNITTTKITWAMAPWKDRTTADYMPVNDCWDHK